MRLVHGEQGGQFSLVSLKLLPRRPDGGMLVRRILGLDDSQKQSIYEQPGVQPACVVVLSDAELVYCQQVVTGEIRKDDVPPLAPHVMRRLWPDTPK